MFGTKTAITTAALAGLILGGSQAMGNIVVYSEDFEGTENPAYIAQGSGGAAAGTGTAYNTVDTNTTGSPLVSEGAYLETNRNFIQAFPENNEFFDISSLNISADTEMTISFEVAVPQSSIGSELQFTFQYRLNGETTGGISLVVVPYFAATNTHLSMTLIEETFTIGSENDVVTSFRPFLQQRRGTTTAEFGSYWDNITITAVPEPGSLALLGLGGVMMLGRRRRNA